MRTVMSASFALLVGCLSVDPPEGRLACAEARVAKDCPGGWACVEGYCYRSPRDAAVSVPDAAALDGEVAMMDGQVAMMDGQVAMDADVIVACTSPSECDDGNGCSIDTCDENVCRHAFTPNELADVPDESGNDENCDGADGVVTRDLYVAPGGTGTGSLNNPASLEAGLGAFEGDRHILVAAGDYAITAPLVAPNGVRLHGGYAPNFRSRPGGTRVLSSASQALIIRDLTAASIDRVDWETAAGTAPGAHTQTVRDQRERRAAATARDRSRRRRGRGERSDGRGGLAARCCGGQRRQRKRHSGRSWSLMRGSRRPGRWHQRAPGGRIVGGSRGHRLRQRRAPGGQCE